MNEAKNQELSELTRILQSLSFRICEYERKLQALRAEYTSVWRKKDQIERRSIQVQLISSRVQPAPVYNSILEVPLDRLVDYLITLSPEELTQALLELNALEGQDEHQVLSD